MTVNLIIDPQEISPDALSGLIESHITDGADLYIGNLHDDVERVRGLLAKGELLIIYSEYHGTARIISAEEMKEIAP